MNDPEYFVILMYSGYLLLVEITPERRSVINEEFSGDEQEYLYSVVAEEFDLSVNDISWSIITESCMSCFGRKPSITKI